LCVALANAPESSLNVPGDGSAHGAH
jgi:hypothetical protein